jgi:hypothetical protein
VLLAWIVVAQFGVVARTVADAPAQASPGALGPYHLRFLAGGIGSTRELPPGTPFAGGIAPWSMTTWIKPELTSTGTVIIAALDEPDPDHCVCLKLRGGAPEMQLHDGRELRADRPLPADSWTAIAVTDDGTTLRLYVAGEQVATLGLSPAGSGAAAAAAADAAAAVAGTVPASVRLSLAPSVPASPRPAHFGGGLAFFQLAARALPRSEVQALAAARPDFDAMTFTTVGAGWPLQEKAWIGLTVPQDPWTLPTAKAAPGIARSQPTAASPPLRAVDADTWTLEQWELLPAPETARDGASLSDPERADLTISAEHWLQATVPGTVLTTLIDRGVYPDPDHGLNNLQIPESLARQDYWYRARFRAPDAPAERRFTLRFDGINYAAELWLNGRRLGGLKGAFLRGVFDATPLLRRHGDNLLVVRVSPPPHPGIPSEESILYGPGENGGALALDGPTFIATEGWDWIPAMRDRDTGIWQAVELHASGLVQIRDPQVITHLPLPRTDSATLRIRVPLRNAASGPREVDLEAAFDGITVRRKARVAAGDSTLEFSPEEFAALNLKQPSLWWPNGYGAPALHLLRLRVLDGGRVSDIKTVRFGIREISYELSLFDSAGRLRRVEVDPTAAPGVALVDGRHEAIKQVPGGWAQSLTPVGEASAAVHDVDSESLAPFLVLRVNGVRIAARGGSWGMDDSRKRISREHLEPFFRLHREAHLNIIRNWLGQNTEEIFYDLADENGLLVLNDFWESTQGFQLEAEDPQLFLANARDVIARYRNHPSIALWFGRNEGVPQPIINEGLAELVRTLDGTRLYTGSSNRVNLQDSGPYSYRPPEDYFTSLGRGFAVELGTPSLATLESLRASIPEPDRWPISDTLAYHDWHFGGNGDVHSFMDAMRAQFGAPDTLEDFERKAQLMNYVDYRAIFEGFAAHLWTQNSGRLLWMTHPAWPSNHWQIYSADYDTQASYYGVKKASETLHVQMNLPDYALAVVNTTRDARPGLSLQTRVLGLDGTELLSQSQTVTAAANAVTTLAPVPLAALLAQRGVVLVALTLRDADGQTLSDNVYWPARDAASYGALDRLAAQRLELGATAHVEGGEVVTEITARNPGGVPILAAKLTLLDAAGHRILPAYYSDNYVSIMPGGTRRITLRYPVAGAGPAHLDVRGWNVAAATAAIAIVPTEPAK